MTYFNESYATVSWDEACQAVVVAWNGFIPLNKAQIAMNKALELYQEKGNKGKWIGDNTRLSAFNKETESWVNENWFPRALGLGLKSLALIVPQSALTKMALDSMMSKVPGTELERAYFDSQVAAKKWLTSR